jgi:hypothetical protein
LKKGIVKKKTVITTEMHEVWVIRQPGEVFAEENREHQESEGAAEALSALPEDDPDKDEPEAQKNY